MQYEYSTVWYADMKSLLESMNGNGVAYGRRGWRIHSFIPIEGADGVTALLERATDKAVRRYG